MNKTASNVRLSGKYYAGVLVVAVILMIVLSYGANVYINYTQSEDRQLHVKAAAQLFSKSLYLKDVLTGTRVDLTDAAQMLDLALRVNLIDRVLVVDKTGKRVLQADSKMNSDHHLDAMLESQMSGKSPDIGWRRRNCIFEVVPVFSSENTYLGKVGIAADYADDAGLVDEVRQIFLILVAPVLLGVIFFAWFFERRQRSRWYRQSIEEVSEKLGGQSAVFDALQEGIIVCNFEGRIMFVNSYVTDFCRDTNFPMLEGTLLEEVDALKPFLETLTQRVPVYLKEIVVQTRTFLVNSLPLYRDEDFVGLVLTAREATEMRKIAEELTGVRTFADTLRAQTHEFMNRLFVIDGLAKFGKLEELRQFLADIVGNYQHEIADITNKIRDERIAGLLLGKASKFREEQIEFAVDDNCWLPEITDSDLAHDLTVIISNLLDNACDAVKAADDKSITVFVRQENAEITIRVDDNGVGMSPEAQNRMFELRFSSKGENRGWGMYLVNNIVVRRNGYIEVCSEVGAGSSITCVLAG
ncbi:MAG: ATP-binding protein [Negativicutes bacterium]|jgi:CitB family two-component system sensor histidine kinase MalK